MRFSTPINPFPLAIALLLAAAALPAQVMQMTTGRSVKAGVSGQKMPCTSDAGDVAALRNFAGQSDATAGIPGPTGTLDFGSYDQNDTIFLCWQDRFLADLDLSTLDLSGDPNPATRPGFGYAIYECPPTVAGDERTDILADPCQVSNGPLANPDGVLFINSAAYRAQPREDTYTFENRSTDPNDPGLPNSLPALFPDTDGSPSGVVLYFAPITIDSLDPSSEAIFEQNSGVGCVNVSTDNVLTVAYLTPITVANEGVRPGNACTGQFTVLGGVPELRGTAGYQIRIEDTSNGNLATITTPANEIRHGTFVEYTVPEPGQYTITIEDGISCGLNIPDPSGTPRTSLTIDHAACRALPPTFDFECGEGAPGEQVCAQVTAVNFDEVLAFDFAFDYDNSVLTFVSGDVLPAELQSWNGQTAAPATGTVRVAYDNASPVSLADGTPVLELCFDIVGNVGDASPLTLRADISREVTVNDADGNPVNFSGGDFPIVTCPVQVIDANLGLDVRTAGTCNGESEGGITVVATGGQAPFTVTITRNDGTAVPDNSRTIGAVGDSAVFTGLDGGIYTATITDQAGDVLSNPQVVVRVFPSYTAIVSDVQEISCFGEQDGVLEVRITLNGMVVSNPTSNGYTIRWFREGSPGVVGTSSILEDLGPGTYRAEVVSPDGCEASPTGVLSARNELIVDQASSATADATCSGSADGSITVVATGGSSSTGDYTYTFSDGTVITDDRATVSNLNPGTYRVTITDDNNCEGIDSFTIDAAKIIGFNLDSLQDVQCFGDADGLISGNATASGAGFDPATDLPFTVSLTRQRDAFVLGTQSVANTTDLFTFDNLDTATYLLRIEDQEGCFFENAFVITQPDSLQIDDFTTVDETCRTDPATGIQGQDGKVQFDLIGGTQPYRIDIINRPVDTTVMSFELTIENYTGDTIRDLAADTTYFATITDANGCTDTVSFEILTPQRAFPTFPIDTAFVSCPESEDGRLTATITVPDGQTLAAAGGISWRILRPDGTLGPEVANQRTTQANLPVGDYVLQLTTTPNGCVGFFPATVASPGPVVIGEGVITPPNCPEEVSGFVTLSPTGGTAPYTFVWSNDPNGAGTQNPVFGPVAAGTYSVTVTDANNCEPQTASFTIADPPRIVADLTTTPTTCPDDTTATGSASAVARFADNSPTTPFTYRWTSNGQVLPENGPVVTGLRRGPITLVVTDGTCNSITYRDTIRSPENFAAEPTITDASCFGDADGAIVLAVTGGTPDYTFAWSNGLADTDNRVDNLTAADYSVTVTDANGCESSSFDFRVSQPDELTLDFLTDRTSPGGRLRCAGDSSGQIGVFVSSVNNNPFPADAYAWSSNVGPDQQDDSLAFNLTPGTYSVTVTDVEGCSDTLSLELTSPDPIVFDVLDIPEPLCESGPLSLTEVSIDFAMGGSANNFEDYTFEVNRDGIRVAADQTRSTFGGDVVITLFDTLGCSATTERFVAVPPPIIIDLEERIIIELGDSTAQLNPIISPAGDVYRYRWTPAEFLSSDSIRTPTVFPLESTQYELEVTNSNGCSEFADIIVEVDANRNVFIPNVFSPNRDGRNDDFRIFACRGVRGVNTVRIFDRWGGLVLERDNIPPNCLDGIPLWDGLGQDGKPVNPGVFVYTVEVSFLDDVTLLYRGDITVLR